MDVTLKKIIEKKSELIVRDEITSQVERLKRQKALWIQRYKERLIDEEFEGVEIKEPHEKRRVGQDIWNQFKRVSIPVFYGDKRAYEGWKVAFVACIHQAQATPEYKLLQLRQHLSEEAKKIVEALEHSAAAYQAAVARLEC